MNRFFSVLALTASFGLAVACAAAGPTVSPSEPSGLVKTATTNPSARSYEVIFTAIDGEKLAQPRGELWLEPGPHELTVSALLEREDSLGMRSDRGKKGAGRIAIEVKDGYIYHIAARMDSSDPKTWAPVIQRVETPDDSQ